MKKVLFFIESLSGGGAEKVLSDIVTNLNKEKYSITVCTVTDSGVYQKEIIQSCNYYSFLHKSNYDAGGFRKICYWLMTRIIYGLPVKWIYNFFIKEQYDIEIAFVEGYATKLIAASKNKNSKKIAWIHIDMIERPYADNYYKSLKSHRDCYSKFNYVVCVSKQAKYKYEKKFRLNNALLVYNPIEKEYIKKFRREYILKEKISLCAVGRLDKQKGFDRLITALGDLKTYNFHLNIIGDGFEKKSLINMVSNLGLNDYVSFLGYLKNPYVEMSKSHLLICSSRSEGFSLVIAEAMCLGIPILSTCCTGPTELIENGKYGILVENSQIGIQQGLLKILRDPSILLELHLLSLKRSEIFDANKIVRKIEGIFGE